MDSTQFVEYDLDLHVIVAIVCLVLAVSILFLLLAVMAKEQGGS